MVADSGAREKWSTASSSRRWQSHRSPNEPEKREACYGEKFEAEMVLSLALTKDVVWRGVEVLELWVGGMVRWSWMFGDVVLWS